MRKLKTLKDIKPCDIIKEGKYTLFNKIFGKEIKDRHISEFVLKKEAIKWVKEHDWIYDINSDDWYNIPEELQLSHEEKGFEDICNWIKYFFNLTEEDFK